MSVKNMKTDILNDKMERVMWVIMIPIIMTQLIDGFYGIIDSLFVANVGSLAVSSVSFVGPIQDTLNAIGTGLTLAGASLIAKFIGSKDEEKASKMIGQLITIGVGIGFLVSAGTFIFSDFILLRSGITEQLLPDATLYLKITAWGTVLNFIVIIYLAIERAQGNTKQASVINAWSLILKIVFCYIFTVIFDFKIAGIGWATIFAKGICAIICIKSMVSKKVDRPISLESLGLDVNLIKVLFITATPLIIEKTIIAYSFVITNKYVLVFGEEVLAAYGITNKINSLFFKAVSSFGLGLSVIVAQNLGGGNIARAEEAIKKAMTYSTILAVACLALVLPFKYQVAAMFMPESDPTYIHIINAMSVYTAAVIPWAITESAMGIFQGTGNTIYNLITSIVRIYVFRVPVVIIFSNPALGFGEFGIWYAMLLSNIFSAIFAYGLYKVKKKQFLTPKNV
ncbi:MAG: MATE family efflux transporter [bacterium]